MLLYIRNERNVSSQRLVKTGDELLFSFRFTDSFVKMHALGFYFEVDQFFSRTQPTNVQPLLNHAENKSLLTGMAFLMTLPTQSISSPLAVSEIGD